MNLSDNFNLLDEKKEECKIIIRIKTTFFKSKKGIHKQKNILFLKRKCKGFNFLDEDCSQVGVEEVIPKIINLEESKDGIYQIITCNERKDWETGYIEEWDYKLIKHE